MWGSSPRKSTRSAKSTSTMLPTDANIEKPTWALTAQSSMPVPSAPLCEMSAMSPGFGLDREERRVEAHARPDDAEAVGAHHAHRVLAEDLLDALLERQSVLADLAEARRDHDRTVDTGLGALEEHVGHRARRRRDERQVHRFRHRSDARQAGDVEDRLVVRVDRKQGTSGRAHQVLHDGPADRTFSFCRPDEGDRLRVKHSSH